MTSRSLRFAPVLLSVITLACATTSPPTATAPVPARVTPEEEVASRARTYWQARQHKDLGGMYAFYSAGYRSRHSRDEFMKKTRLIRFDIIDFKVDGVAAAGDRADVTIGYHTNYPPKLMDPVPAKVTETWILDADRQWYKERETILLPFPGKLGSPQEVED
jgi:hypothetical protein